MNPIKISNMNAIESQLQLYFDGLFKRRSWRLHPMQGSPLALVA